MAGYDGFSMSNNARAAYAYGMMPRSKWTKKAMLERAAELDCAQERVQELRGLSVAVLRELLLTCREWHHTSSHFNRTDFWDVNEDVLTWENDDWAGAVAAAKAAVAQEKEQEKEQEKGKKAAGPVRVPGRFFWVTWEGTRNHPRAREHRLDQAFVETRGKFFHVFDADGVQVVRKMVGSNGTVFVPAV